MHYPTQNNNCASKTPSMRASGQGDVTTRIVALERAELLSDSIA